MATDFFRALSTIKVLQEELMHERDAHSAMKMCFEKIHKSLDMYQGHYINRLRFHLNRHHTEYLRKVRAMRKEQHKSTGGSHDDTDSSGSQRRSMRVGAAQDLAKEVERLQLIVRRKDLEIERLAMLLDEADNNNNKASEKEVDTTTTNQEKKKNKNEESNDTYAAKRMKKLMNPYYPTDDEDEDDSAAEQVILLSAAATAGSSTPE